MHVVELNFRPERNQCRECHLFMPPKRGRGNGRKRGRGRGRGAAAASAPTGAVRARGRGRGGRGRSKKQRIEEKEDPLAAKQQELVGLFADLAQPENLNKIRRETMIEGRKHVSETIMDAIKPFIASLPPDTKNEFEGCRLAELPCIITLLENVTTPETIKKIIPYLQELMPVIYQNTNSRTSNYGALRDSIEEKYKDYPDIIQMTKSVLHISQASALERKMNYAADVHQRNINQIEISDKAILKIISDYQFSTNWRELMVVAGLAVGSRMIEIIKVSDYKKPDAPANPHWIKIIGVAKDTGEGERDAKDGLGGKRIIVKPIIGLVNDDIIRIVSTIRKILSDSKNWDLGKLPDGRETKGQPKSNQAIANNVSQMLQQTVKKMVGEPYTFHKLRAMYAEMAWTIYPVQGKTKTAYYSEVLGHKPTSLTTALSYQRFQAHRELEQEDPNLKSAIAGMMVDLEAIKKQLADNALVAEGMVQFIGSDGKEFLLRKQPNIHDKNEEARMARLKQKVKELADHGLAATRSNLKKLGFGMGIIVDYKKELRESAPPPRLKLPTIQAEEMKEKLFDIDNLL